MIFLHSARAACPTEYSNMSVAATFTWDNDVAVGENATFACDTGYYPTDAPAQRTMTTTCTDNGSWIETPHCTQGTVPYKMC